MMKKIRVLRIALSVAVLLVTTMLVWQGRNETLAHYQLTLNLSSMALGVLVTWLIVTLNPRAITIHQWLGCSTMQGFMSP